MINISVRKSENKLRTFEDEQLAKEKLRIIMQECKALLIQVFSKLRKISKKIFFRVRPLTARTAGISLFFLYGTRLVRNRYHSPLFSIA